MEYILRNLDNPIVEAGLNVSYYWLFFCAAQNSLFLLITSQSADCNSSISYFTNDSQDLKSEPSLLVEIITRSVSTRMAGMLGSGSASLHGGSEWCER